MSVPSIMKGEAPVSASALSGVEGLLDSARKPGMTVVVAENEREREKLLEIAVSKHAALVPPDPFRAFVRTKKIARQLPAASLEERDAALRPVGLPIECAWRYPHEFSAGQLQRLSLARALAEKPVFIACDDALRELDSVSASRFVECLRRLPTGSLLICSSADTAPRDASMCLQLTNGKVTEIPLPLSADFDTAPVKA